MHDVVIRGGTIVDGTGKPAFTGDLALAADRVATVGKDLGSAKKTIDADGLLVTPAWVDIHTHYDGQVAWDEQMTPSLWHGVSTVVMGNCGVGFAPATPGSSRLADRLDGRGRRYSWPVIKSRFALGMAELFRISRCVGQHATHPGCRRHDHPWRGPGLCDG